MYEIVSDDVLEMRARIQKLEKVVEAVLKETCYLCRRGEPIVGEKNGEPQHSYYCGGWHSGGKSCRCGTKSCEAPETRKALLEAGVVLDQEFEPPFDDE